jgi:valyl-tRNA synthetase
LFGTTPPPPLVPPGLSPAGISSMVAHQDVMSIAPGWFNKEPGEVEAFETAKFEMFVRDLAAETARLIKEIAVFESDAAHVMKKLGNPNFVAKAAEAVIDENRAKLAEAEAGKARLTAALERLQALG